MIKRIQVNSSKMGALIIQEVPKNLAKQFIINNHYSGKWNAGFGLYNYGIFKAGEE